MNPPDDIKRWLSYNRDTGLFRWIAARKKVCVGDIAGSVSKSSGYVEIKFCQKLYYAHRLAWWFVHGVMPQRIDHRDTVRHHNWIENLRLATQSQNLANASLRSDNSSGFKGVFFFKPTGRWASKIQVRGEAKHLGYFSTPEEAAAAYDAAACEHFGDFARVNLQRSA